MTTKEGGLRGSIRNIGVGVGIPDSVQTQDLNAWYRFEDGDARDYASDAEYPNTTWGDSTAYDGTVNGATYLSSGGVTDFENGANSGAFDFDGTDNDVDLDDIYKQDPITTMTWANRDTDAGYVLSLSNRFDLAYEVFDSNGFEFSTFDGSNRETITSGNTTAGSYVHLAATSDASTIEFYVNGVSQGTVSTSPAYPTSSWRIGEQSNGGDNFNGSIDDVRIYSTALTSTQITEIYNSTSP